MVRSLSNVLKRRWVIRKSVEEEDVIGSAADVVGGDEELRRDGCAEEIEPAALILPAAVVRTPVGAAVLKFGSPVDWKSTAPARGGPIPITEIQMHTVPRPRRNRFFSPFITSRLITPLSPLYPRRRL